MFPAGRGGACACAFAFIGSQIARMCVCVCVCVSVYVCVCVCVCLQVTGSEGDTAHTPVRRTRWRCPRSTGGAGPCISGARWCRPVWCTSDIPATGRSHWTNQYRRIDHPPPRGAKGKHGSAFVVSRFRSCRAASLETSTDRLMWACIFIELDYGFSQTYLPWGRKHKFLPCFLFISSSGLKSNRNILTNIIKSGINKTHQQLSSKFLNSRLA